MWYYSLNDEPAGPVDDEQLKALFSRGVINFDTLVWKEGMSEWKRYGSITLTAENVSPVAPQSTLSPYINEPGRPKGSGLRSLYGWWLATKIIATVVYPVLFYLSMRSAMAESTLTAVLMPFICVAGLAGVTSGILQYVLLYKLWKVGQDGYASTTAGKAVGFMFIPLFNYYWAFRAYWGLSKDLNKYCERYFADRADVEVRSSQSWISLTYLVISLGGGIFSNLIFRLIYGGDYASALASAATTPEGVFAAMTPMLIFIAGFILITTVLEIAMFNDFHQTAQSILEAEKRK
jgi:hypothetical protein